MSNTEKLYKEMREMESALSKMQNEFQEKMRKLFTDMTEQFFVETPKIKAVVWDQYTPYFNDGEECTFSVHDVYFLTEELDEEDLQSAYNYEEASFNYNASTDAIASNKDYAKRFPSSAAYYLKEAAEMEALLAEDDGTIDRCASMARVIGANEDLMRAIFDDHVTVYVTQAKSFTEECDHD